MAQVQKYLIYELCNKVEEVLNNNDWPTEDGHETSDGPKSYMRNLIDMIRISLGD